MIYVIDFGLVDDFTMVYDDADDFVPRRPHLVGTMRFTSVRGHEGRGAYTCSFYSDLSISKMCFNISSNIETF